MDTQTFAAISALVLSLSGNIIQFLKDRKKQNMDTISLLLDNAMKLNKQEVETVRELNKTLEDKIKELEAHVDRLEKELEEKDVTNRELRKRVTELEILLEKIQSSVRKLERNEEERK